MIDAIIMAAGKGTRLKPITEEIPKAMAQVNGKPILERILDQLNETGIMHAVIIVHYYKEQIIKHFGTKYKNVKLTYAEQKELKGTADAVLTAEKYVKSDRFFVIACDSLFNTEHLRKMLKHKDGVLTVCKVENPKRYGVITTDGKKATGIIEKSENPPTNLANTSIYLFSKKIFETCKKVKKSPRGEYELTDAIQMMIDSGEVFEYEIIPNWLDIGTIQDLEEAQNLGKIL